LEHSLVFTKQLYLANWMCKFYLL